MRALVCLCLCAAAWGEEAPPQSVQDNAQSAQNQSAAGSSGVFSPLEQRVSGSLDLGYRWRAGFGGNENVYRSIVDLGEGPKLLGTDLAIVDPKHRWFEQIEIHAANWGDDPYTTLTVRVRKSRVYDFTSSYRNIAYFNNVPSFANSFLERGGVSSAQTSDLRNRISSFELDLLPGTWLMPYVAYDRSSSYGSGVTSFVSDQNEYPVPYTSNFSDDNMRGGIRIELSRFHATIEQGGTTFRDDEALRQSSGTNLGTRSTPLLGKTLALSALSQAYGVRGDSVYSKALATAQPTAWLSLYGQYLFSRPRNETKYQQFNAGNFVLQSQALFFTSQQYLINSSAKLPHQSAQAGAEIRLHPHLRMLANWLTDRIHVSGDSAGLNRVSGPSLQQLTTAEVSATANQYSHAEGDLVWDVTSHLMLRGGYRYEWGRTSTFVLPPAGLVSTDAAGFRRNVGKAGFHYRVGSLSVTGDAEAAGTGAAYFRTSPYRYQKGHLQASYQFNTQLTLSMAFSGLSNQNPAPNVDLTFRGLETSASVMWNPVHQKHLSFLATYTRSTIRSDIDYLIPQTLQPDRSRYRDNEHSTQGLVEISVPRLGTQAKISAGGNFLISSGSRPTDYFQPVAKLMIPVTHGISWLAEWTYYSYGESFYSYEGFRAHLVTAGLRITL